MQTTTLVESIPHRDGPIQTLEESHSTMGSQAPQLQEFAEGISKLIQQVPVVREATRVVKAGNETRKRTEEVVSNVLCRSLSHAENYISMSRACEHSTSSRRLPLSDSKRSMLGFRG